MNKSLKTFRKVAGIAALTATSAAFVACDGDTTNVNASGEAADIEPIAPTETQLPLSTLNAVVDEVLTGSTASWSDGAAIEVGHRFRFNFLSASQIEIFENFTNGGPNAQTSYEYVEEADETEFSVIYQTENLSGTPGEIEINFTVLDSEGYTLIGTFLTGSQILVDTFALNVFGSDGIDIENSDLGNTDNNIATNAGLGRTGANRPTITAGTGGNNQFANIPEGALVVLLDDSSVWIIDASEVDVDDTNDEFDTTVAPSLADAIDNYDPTTDLLLLDGTTGANDLSGELQTEYDAGDETAWRKIEITAGVEDDSVAGTFRLDMNPSQGGTGLLDTEGLSGIFFGF
ncbi:MAG: hypothetical protein JJT75_04530 [Opitutales bacterium]|nr:hypothetical protein [Opitutales bacterium]MCH8541346.1 hypothetical protein [Opitutales bacterium]